jgi:hypothetical protein
MTGSLVAITTLVTRLPVLLAGVVVVTMIGTTPPPAAEALWRVSANEVANLLARWDTAFYYSIATSGYQWDPGTFSHQNVVFFPLYPLLMRWGGVLLGGHPLLAGLIVSLLAFAGSVAVLHRLAVLEIGEEPARTAVILLSTFPYALFFSVVYTESLFLLVTVGAFYAMRRGHIGAVAACGAAAGLVRPNGFWLALPLACLAYRGRPHKLAAFAAASTPLIGAALFSGYLFLRFGEALAWVHGQAAWGAVLLGRWPAPDPTRLPGEPTIKVTEVITWIGNIGAFAVAAAAIVPVWRRFGAAYATWIAVTIFPPVPMHLFISLGRFTAVLFPVFFWMALRIPRSRVPRVAAAFAGGQLVLAVWFFLWRPVV